MLGLDERRLAWDRTHWVEHTVERSPALSSKDLADYVHVGYYDGRTIGWIYVVDPKLSIPKELRKPNADGTPPKFTFQVDFETAESAWNTAWPITPENIVLRFACFSDKVHNTIIRNMVAWGKNEKKYLYAWGK